VNAPDPADYGHLPGDAEFVRSIPELPSLEGVPAAQRFDHAKRQGLIQRHTKGMSRPIVKLPDEGSQLGSRWLYLLTQEQIGKAMQTGMFDHLAAGHDPDAAASSTP
jgi:hypothetical protein